MNKHKGNSTTSEDEYFHAQDQRALTRLREKRAAAGEFTQQQRFADDVGVDDAAVLTALCSAGLTTENFASFELLPCIVVAWADDEVNNAEHTVLRTIAVERGIVPGSSAAKLFEAWLREPPDEALLELWFSWLTAISRPSGRVRLWGLQRDMPQMLRRVVSAAPSILGIRTPSRLRSRVISRVKRALEAAPRDD